MAHWDKALTDPKAVKMQVESVIEEYKERGKPLVVAAIGAAIGCHRDLVKEYAHGEHIPPLADDGSNRKEVEEQREIASILYHAYLLCDAAIQDTLAEHGGNNGAIFLAKSTYGYTDVQRLEIVTPTFGGENDV